MHKKVVLFDFDGTIAATVDAGIIIFNQLAQKYGFGEITPENIPDLRGKGVRYLIKELHVPRLRVPMIVNRLRKGVKSQIAAVGMIADIKPILVKLKENGCEIGIVTSNIEENVLAFLENNDLELFDHVHAGSGIFYKAGAIRKTIKRNNLKGCDIIFVGDEIRDVVAAKRNKLRTIGVTWGLNSRKGLEEAGADFVVDNIEELSKILTAFSGNLL
jgi:phosphoglycolate phosphatase